ncbi:hypothetical protein Tco_0613421 [Tanacetum coccineum]
MNSVLSLSVLGKNVSSRYSLIVSYPYQSSNPYIDGLSLGTHAIDGPLLSSELWLNLTLEEDDLDTLALDPAGLTLALEEDDLDVLAFDPYG